ncbi:MAG: methyltransferase domain-containing protein [Deltaproteobacteria bacterium]|nr:methyltransferase domain-containing protein [Deltaproteobacteria bacterium]
MKEKSGPPDYSEIIAYEKRSEGKQHHRGKTSERLLDKVAILSALAIEFAQTILDAGCGNGYMSKEFSQLVGPSGRVYALDSDDTGIAVLSEETKGTNIVAMAGDITTDTELPASTIDLIYLSTVFHIFSPKQVKGFEAEVKRLLRPRGKLAIVEIVKRTTPFGPPLNMRLSPEDLRHTLRLAALDTVEVGEYFYMQLFENRSSI